jgi:hypothetical protein
LQLRPGQVNARADEEQPFGHLASGVGQGGLAAEYVVEARLAGLRLYAEVQRGVRLWVEVE